MSSSSPTTLSSTSFTSTNILTNGNTSPCSSSSSGGSSSRPSISPGSTSNNIDRPVPKARQYFIDKQVRINNEEYPTILFTMATCLNDDEKDMPRINQLIEKKAFKKNDIKPTRSSYKAEILRRFTIVNEYEESDDFLGGEKQKTRMPRYKNWDVSKLMMWLKSNPLIDDDKKWVIQALEHFCDHHEQKLNAAEQDKVNKGMGIRQIHLNRMRLAEAIVLDENRDSLMRLSQTLKRQELDARNSEKERVECFYEKLSNCYNNKEWVPKSTPYGEFHFELNRLIELPFDETSGPMTVEQVKATYRDMRAKLNIALSKWKASGAGEGRREDSAKFRFNGTSYIQQVNNDGGDDSSSDEDEIEYINDNRADFIQGHLSVGYLWCLLESHGLVTACSQNCEAIGMTMDSTREASKQKCFTNSSSGGSKRKAGDSEEKVLQSIERMMSSNKASSNAIHNENVCYDTWYDAREDMKEQKGILRDLKINYFKAKKDGDDDLMELFEEEIAEQEIICEEANNTLKEAKEELAKAKKHAHDLDTRSMYENVNSNNIHSHKSQSKKKKPRTMTEAEEESMAIMRDTTHSFTSTLSSDIIQNVEYEKASMYSTVDLRNGNTGSDSDSD